MLKHAFELKFSNKHILIYYNGVPMNIQTVSEDSHQKNKSAILKSEYFGLK